MSINRRNFLRLSGAGIAGSLIAGNINASPANIFSFKSKKIVYRKLGKTGIKVPIVSLGVMRVDNENLIRAAYEGGIRYFDTANSYLRGKSESILAQALKAWKRDTYVISTKISSRGEFSEKDMTDKLNTSLQRLEMDYVDILYLHGAGSPEQVKDEKIIKLFQDFKKQGKTRFIGISVHGNIPQVIKAVVESKAWDVVLTSYNFKMEDFSEVKDAVAMAAKAGIGVVAMKTMAGVYWDKEKTKKINTKAALKWVLNDENIATAIPGCTSFDHLQENLTLINGDLKLTDQERTDLDVSKNMAGLICVGCQECVPQCPHKVPVPDMMRAYMYAYGYNDMKLAHDVVISTPEASLCTLCPECKVECRMGFNVKERTADIVRIKDIPEEFLA